MDIALALWQYTVAQPSSLRPPKLILLSVKGNLLEDL